MFSTTPSSLRANDIASTLKQQIKFFRDSSLLSHSPSSLPHDTSNTSVSRAMFLLRTRVWPCTYMGIYFNKNYCLLLNNENSNSNRNVLATKLTVRKLFTYLL